MAKMIPLSLLVQANEQNNKKSLFGGGASSSLRTFFQIRFLKSGKIISHFGDLPPMKALYEMAKHFHEHIGVFVGDLKICDTSWYLPNLEVSA